MSDREIMQTEQEIWATVELMGHGQTAGRISKPTEWGGLIRVDVPVDENGNYRTELYGASAIYAVKFVSEEIARAYCQPTRGIVSYDTPIVTREQHQKAIDEAQRENYRLRDRVNELERRLTAVNALPSGEVDKGDGIQKEIPF